MQARQAILVHFKQGFRAVFFTLSNRLGITEADAKIVQVPGRRLWSYTLIVDKSTVCRNLQHPDIRSLQMRLRVRVLNFKPVSPRSLRWFKAEKVGRKMGWLLDVIM